MRKICTWMCAAALLLALAVPAAATETEPPVPATEIHTPEDLQLLAQDPSGSFILMQDLDMTGIVWKSLDFAGSLDGNGHTIYNLTLSEPGNERPESMDGNFRTYETAYVGMFGTLRDAEVKNLSLVGLKGLAVSDEPCFLGGIAGFMDNTTITNCTVSGILELRAHDRIFGVGGMVGFGKGIIENCTVDVTLICTDTNPDKRDEQFMGGVLAAGYATVRNCVVTIDGYCSEFGYCHNGGMVGMLVERPVSTWPAEVQDNAVTGKITFFEWNSDRRAYCRGVIGENLAYSDIVSRNEEDFLRDERGQCDVELRPEMCPEPVYTSVVTPPTCDAAGYTTHTCDLCGYSYADSYTLPEHIPGEWILVREATYEETGLWTATCPCGMEYQKEDPKLDPPPTEPPTEPPTQPPTEPSTEMTEPETEPAPPAEESKFSREGMIKDACMAAIPLMLLVIVFVKRREEA